jgi:hypothetical protein
VRFIYGPPERPCLVRAWLCQPGSATKFSISSEYLASPAKIKRDRRKEVLQTNDNRQPYADHTP